MKGVYVLGGCRNRLNEKDCYKVVLKSKTVNNKNKKNWYICSKVIEILFSKLCNGFSFVKIYI